MKPNEILKEILDETYIILSSLDAEDIDIALSALSKRNALIEKFNRVHENPLDPEAEKMIRTFDEINAKCIEKLANFKSRMEREMFNTKSKKIDMKQKQKVHEQYSNPYLSGAVGTSFDLKK